MGPYCCLLPGKTDALRVVDGVAKLVHDVMQAHPTANWCPTERVSSRQFHLDACLDTVYGRLERSGCCQRGGGSAVVWLHWCLHEKAHDLSGEVEILAIKHALPGQRHVVAGHDDDE